MRTLTLSLALLCSSACGFVPKPAEQTSNSERLTLAQVESLAVGKLARDQFKEKFGKPDRTVEDSDTVTWVWDDQRIVWDAAAEKYPSQLFVYFPKDPNGKVVSIQAG